MRSPSTAVQRGVLAAMRDLARGGSHGAHRLPLADLTVAVAARQSGLDVVHFDRHFDRLAGPLGIHALWIAEPVGPGPLVSGLGVRVG